MDLFLQRSTRAFAFLEVAIHSVQHRFPQTLVLCLPLLCLALGFDQLIVQLLALCLDLFDLGLEISDLCF